ncbi:creatininase family protein [Rhizosaccharibacter radicis]|uniref:Creatininase family protein n=1 Tax=Rhizosaccharibacter radicis TaxID=2782605 RepID=A0ABT1VY95_9PROT|nr:creatininase family protein [Acetobacteraceae bacterium KSS12]
MMSPSPSPTGPHPERKIRLADLTSAELSDLLPGRPVVLLPMGSLEDQGTHAPMGDYRCAERIAELIAMAADSPRVRVLSAPVVPFGGRDFFGSRPGGIALRPGTLLALLDDMLASLLRHGLDRLIVVNGHGGNGPSIFEATQEVLRTQNRLIPCLHLWRIAGSLLPHLLGPELAARSTGHGADPLWSVVQHLFPERCRPDLMPHPDAPAQVVHGLRVADYGAGLLDTRHGEVEIGLPLEAPARVTRGDPRRGSPQTGAAIVERLVGTGHELIGRLLAGGW